MVTATTVREIAALTSAQAAALAAFRALCAQAWSEFWRSDSFTGPAAEEAAAEFRALTAADGAIARQFAAVVAAFGGADQAPEWAWDELRRIAHEDGAAPAPAPAQRERTAAA